LIRVGGLARNSESREIADEPTSFVFAEKQAGSVTAFVDDCRYHREPCGTRSVEAVNKQNPEKSGQIKGYQVQKSQKYSKFFVIMHKKQSLLMCKKQKRQKNPSAYCIFLKFMLKLYYLI
jgi:hypothetical protein